MAVNTVAAAGCVLVPADGHGAVFRATHHAVDRRRTGHGHHGEIRVRYALVVVERQLDRVGTRHRVSVNDLGPDRIDIVVVDTVAVGVKEDVQVPLVAQRLASIQRVLVERGTAIEHDRVVGGESAIRAGHGHRRQGVGRRHERQEGAEVRRVVVTVDDADRLVRLDAQEFTAPDVGAPPDDAVLDALEPAIIPAEPRADLEIMVNAGTPGIRQRRDPDLGIVVECKDLQVVADTILGIGVDNARTRTRRDGKRDIRVLRSVRAIGPDIDQDGLVRLDLDDIVVKDLRVVRTHQRNGGARWARHQGPAGPTLDVDVVVAVGIPLGQSKDRAVVAVGKIGDLYGGVVRQREDRQRAAHIGVEERTELDPLVSWGVRRRRGGPVIPVGPGAGHYGHLDVADDTQRVIVEAGQLVDLDLVVAVDEERAGGVQSHGVIVVCIGIGHQVFDQDLRRQGRIAPRYQDQVAGREADELATEFGTIERRDVGEPGVVQQAGRRADIRVAGAGVQPAGPDRQWLLLTGTGTALRDDPDTQPADPLERIAGLLEQERVRWQVVAVDAAVGRIQRQAGIDVDQRH